MFIFLIIHQIFKIIQVVKKIEKLYNEEKGEL